jgi:ribosomal protein S18 acetylase RimI-like enzyme
VIVVRSAVAADFDAVAEVTVGAYHAGGQLDGDNAGYAAQLADVARRAGLGEILVALNDSGELVGAVSFVVAGSPYADLAGPGEAEFRALAVRPDAQGTGVGTALVRACVDRARELGSTAVMICTRDRNETAQRLYAREGFVPVPEHDFSPRPGVNLLALRLPLVPVEA